MWKKTFLPLLFTITEKILKCHVKYCLKINRKQMMKMPKEGEYVRFKHYKRTQKSPSKIYANFESILLPKDNGKQDSDTS